MADDLVQFDDPDLKAAIVRVRGGHTARPELVDRVRQSLATAMGEPGNGSGHAPPDASPMRIPHAGPSTRWRMIRRLAVAASILLAFGLGMVFQQVRHEAAEREEYLAANHGLFRDMIAVHTGADSASANPQPFAAGASVATLRDQASAKLARYVPLPDLASQGWTLKEAAVRQFHSLPAASFVFTRGNRTITLLSLPAQLYAFAHEGETYETVIDGSPIAGFISRGGVHCVVGDAGTPLSDVTSITDALRRS
jgi:hypothetical protein